jgi:hypothetical protein
MMERDSLLMKCAVQRNLVIPDREQIGEVVVNLRNLRHSPVEALQKRSCE